MDADPIEMADHLLRSVPGMSWEVFAPHDLRYGACRPRERGTSAPPITPGNRTVPPRHLPSRLDRRRPMRRVGALITLITVVSIALGGSTPSAGAVTAVTVAVKPIEPFVTIDADGEPSGYSIDLWNSVAEQLGYTTTFQVHETVREVIDAVASGSADAGIAAISITAEREELVDFTHPYFDAGLRIMVRSQQDQSPLVTALKSVVNAKLLLPLLLLAVLIVVMAHLIWMTERKVDGDFPQPYARGIRESIWWSLVNITTGGDAEKKIQRPLGRVIAGMWMLLGLFIVALVTAQVTTALTVQELRSDIGSVDDLYGREVVTVQDTLADAELDRLRVDHRRVETIDDAFEALRSGDADAVVYDAPVLEFYANTTGRGSVEVIGPILSSDTYGIALPSGSPMREDINEVLLTFNRDGTPDRLYRAWFDR
jgi:polar amino acid transport system substrate-binding protein